MQSCYFKIEKLEQPRSVLAGHTFVGFVFVESKTKDGKVAFFPWERFKNNANNSYVLVEVNEIEKAGCPYPPPCDDASGLIGCY
jgi:hypothetical protein